MKKCPKCGADNQPESLECSSCRASFQGAGQPAAYRPTVAGPATVNPYRPAVAGPSSVDNVVRSGGPLGGDDVSNEPVAEVGRPLNYQQQQQPSIYNNPQADNYGAPVGPPRIRYRENPDMAPVRHSVILSLVGPVVTLLIVLAIGGFLYWKYMYLPKGPLAAMRVFVPAAVGSNLNDLQACSSKESQVIFQEAIKMQKMGRGTVSFDFFQASSMGFNEGEEYELKVQSVDANTAKVLVRPGPAPIDSFKEESLSPKYKDGYTFTLVKEGEQWKVDLAQFVKEWQSNATP